MPAAAGRQAVGGQLQNESLHHGGDHRRQGTRTAVVAWLRPTRCCPQMFSWCCVVPFICAYVCANVLLAFALRGNIS